MKPEYIVKLLGLHYIDTRVANGRVYAVETYAQNGVLWEEEVDVTDYTKRELYQWLGYSDIGIA